MNKKPPSSVTLRDVNDYLTCGICRGYLIDATTNSICLHSFCRSCVLRYLDREEKFCPVCRRKCENGDTLLSELSSDRLLQTIVFKVVPNLYHTEIQRRIDFIRNSTGPAVDLTGSGSDSWRRKQRRALRLDSKNLYTGDEHINVCLVCCESFPFEFNEICGVFPEAKETTEGVNDTELGERLTEKHVRQRYLLCPSKMTIGHLKKYIRYKFDMDDGFEIEIFHSKDSLLDKYSLIDVAYIYYNSQKVAHLTLQYIILDTVSDGKPPEPECNNNSLPKKQDLKRKLDLESVTKKSDDSTRSPPMQSNVIADRKKCRIGIPEDITSNDHGSLRESRGPLNRSDVEPIEERNTRNGVSMEDCSRTSMDSPAEIVENLNSNTDSNDLNCLSAGEVSLAVEENSDIIAHIEGTSSFAGAVGFLESKGATSAVVDFVRSDNPKVLGILLNPCSEEGNEKVSADIPKEKAYLHVSPYKNRESSKASNLHVEDVEIRDFFCGQKALTGSRNALPMDSWIPETTRDVLESDNPKKPGQEIEQSKDSDAEIDTEIRRIAANVTISDENSMTDYGMNEDSESTLPSPYQGDHGEAVLGEAAVGRGHGNIIDSITISQLFAPSISTSGVGLSVGDFLLSSVHAPFECMVNGNGVTNAAEGLSVGNHRQGDLSRTEQIENSDYGILPDDCGMLPLHNSNFTIGQPYLSYFPVVTADMQMSSGPLTDANYFSEFQRMNPIFSYPSLSHYNLSKALNTSTNDQYHSNNLSFIMDTPVLADNSYITDTNTAVAIDVIAGTNRPDVTDSSVLTDTSNSICNGQLDIRKPDTNSFKSHNSGNMDLNRCLEAALQVVICTNSLAPTGSTDPLTVTANDGSKEKTVVDKRTSPSGHPHPNIALNIGEISRSPKENHSSHKGSEQIRINFNETDVPQTTENSAQFISPVQDDLGDYSVTRCVGKTVITNENQPHEISIGSVACTHNNQPTKAILCETSNCELLRGLKAFEHSCSALSTNGLKENIEGIIRDSVNTDINRGIIGSHIALTDNACVRAETVSGNHETITNVLRISTTASPKSCVEKKLTVSKTIVRNMEKELYVPPKTLDIEKGRIISFPQQSMEPEIVSLNIVQNPTRHNVLTVLSDVKSTGVCQNDSPKFLHKDVTNKKNNPDLDFAHVLSSVLSSSPSLSSSFSLLSSQPSALALSSSSTGTTATTATIKLSPNKSLLTKAPAQTGTKIVETSCNGQVGSKISVGTQTNIDLLGRYFKRRVNPVNSFLIAGKSSRPSGKDRSSKCTKTSLPVATPKSTSYSSMSPTVTLSVGGGPIVSHAAILLSGNGAPILIPAMNGKSAFLITVPGNFSFQAQNGIRPNMTLIQTRLSYPGPRPAPIATTISTMAPLIFHPGQTTSQNMIIGRTMRPPLQLLLPSALSAPQMAGISNDTPITTSLNGPCGYTCRLSLNSNQPTNEVSVASPRSAAAPVAATANSPYICAMAIPSQILSSASLASLYRMDNTPATKIGLSPVTIQSHSSGICVVSTSSSSPSSVSSVSYLSLSAATFPTFVLSNATPSALQNHTSVPYGGGGGMRSNLITVGPARTTNELNSKKPLSDNSFLSLTRADCSTVSISSTSRSLSSPTACPGLLSKLGARHISISNIPHVGNKFTVSRKGSDATSAPSTAYGPGSKMQSESCCVQRSVAPIMTKSPAEINVSFQFDAKSGNYSVVKGQRVEGASVSLIRAILERNLTSPYDTEKRSSGTTAITKPKVDTVSNEGDISKADNVNPIIAPANNILLKSPVNAVSVGRAKRPLSVTDELCFSNHNVPDSYETGIKKSKSVHIMVENGSSRRVLNSTDETAKINESLVMGKTSISNSCPPLSEGCMRNKSTSVDGRTASPSETEDAESFVKLPREIAVSGVVTRSQRSVGRTNEVKGVEPQSDSSTISSASTVGQIESSSRRRSAAEANLKIVSPPSEKKRRRSAADSRHSSANKTTTISEDSDLQTPLLVAVFTKQCNIGSERCPVSSENELSSSCVSPVTNTTKSHPSTPGLSTKSLSFVETAPFISENKLSVNDQTDRSLRRSADNHYHSRTTLSSSTINRQLVKVLVPAAETPDISSDSQNRADETKRLAANTNDNNSKPGWASMAVQTRCGMVALPKKVYTYFGSAVSHEHIAAREKNMDGQVANNSCTTSSTNPQKEDVTHIKGNGTATDLKRGTEYRRRQQVTSPYLSPNDDDDDDTGSQVVAPPINQLRRMCCNFIQNGSREKSPPTVEIELLPPRLSPFT